MKFDLPKEDELKLISLFQTNHLNYRALSLFSSFLYHYEPSDITEESFRKIKSGSVPDGMAYGAIFETMMGEMMENFRLDGNVSFIRNHLYPAFASLDEADYRCDYGTLLQNLSAIEGDCHVFTDHYDPYTPFVYDDYNIDEDKYFRVVPRIGFFRSRFDFPSIEKNGLQWMALIPNETNTMRKPIEKASGNVLTLGLGLGYYAFETAKKENVQSVTVVEKDPFVISLFRKHLLPLFPNKEKIKIVEADAFDYLRDGKNLEGTDYVFSDLWHDASDGIPLYIRLLHLIGNLPVKQDYWVEKTLLEHVRLLVIDILKDGYDGNESVPEGSTDTEKTLRHSLSGHEFVSYKDIRSLLSDSGLRNLLVKADDAAL